MLPLTSFIDELEKIAGSRLREQFSVTPEVETLAPGRFQHKWVARLGAEPIGHMTVDNGQVATTLLDEKYRGMGLGKKMYGEVMRRMPGQTLKSDSLLSDSAHRTWEALQKNKGYAVQRAPDAARGMLGTQAAGAVFKGSLPAQAAIPTALPAFPLPKGLRERASWAMNDLAEKGMSRSMGLMMRVMGKK